MQHRYIFAVQKPFERFVALLVELLLSSEVTFLETSEHTGLLFSEGNGATLWEVDKSSSPPGVLGTGKAQLSQDEQVL